MRNVLLKLEERRSFTVSSSYVETEFISNQLSYLAEEIFNQSVEGVPGCLLTAYSKMQKEIDKFRKELFSKIN